MCGYLIYPTKPTSRLLEQHLKRQSHRGVDGYGAISLGVATDKDISYIRHLKEDKFLISFRETAEGGVMVHHRKASVGGVRADLVHPLADEANEVWLMQNGTRRALADIFNCASDSVALAEYWNRVDDKALVNILDGCGVVIVYTEGSIWFHRDSGRTLYHCKEGRAKGMYSSEPMEAGMWALVDEYGLKKLPLKVSEWNLECGEAEEYTDRVCVVGVCKESFVGNATTHRCPNCPPKTKYWAGSSGYYVPPAKPYTPPARRLV